MATTEVDFPASTGQDYNGSPAGVALKSGVSIGFRQYMLVVSPFDQGGSNTILRWLNGASSANLASVASSTGTIVIGDLIRLSSTRFVLSYTTTVSGTSDTWLKVIDSAAAVQNNGGAGYRLQPTASGNGGPIIATNSTTIYATYQDGSSNWKIAKSTDSGNTFTVGGTIANAGRLLSGGLAVIAGNIYAMWHDQTNNLVKVFKSTDDGATWSLFSTSNATHVAFTSNSVSSYNISGMFYDATCWAFAYNYNDGSTDSIRFNKTLDGGTTWSDYVVATVGGFPSVGVYVVHRGQFQVQWSDGDGTLLGTQDPAHLKESLDGGTTWTTPPSVVNQPSATYGAYYQAKMTNGLAATSGLDGGETTAYTAVLYSYSTGWYTSSNEWLNVGTNPDASSTAGFGPAITLNNSIQPTAGFGPSVTLVASPQPTAGFGPSITLAVAFPYGRSNTDAVTLSDSVSGNIVFSKTASDTVRLSQAVNGFGDTSTEDILSLSDSISAIKVTSQAVSNSISLTDSKSVQKVSPQSVADTPSISQSIVDNLALGKSDTDSISLTDTVTDNVVKQNIDNISLSDSVGLGLVINLSIVDDIQLTDDAVSVGGSTKLGSCGDTKFPNLGRRDLFTFEHAGLGLTVDLPRLPEFSNTQETSWGREIRRTLSGQFSMAQGPWATIDILKWRFRFLSESKRIDIEDFLEQTTGLEITIIDQENTTWTGVVLNEEIDFKPEGRGCQWSFEIDFRVTSRSIE